LYEEMGEKRSPFRRLPLLSLLPGLYPLIPQTEVSAIRSLPTQLFWRTQRGSSRAAIVFRQRPMLANAKSVCQ